MKEVDIQCFEEIISFKVQPDECAGWRRIFFQYRKFIDSIVATNKQAQVTNTTSVLGSAVESVSPTDASAVVYTNSIATSPVSKNIPSLRYLSYRLEMKRDRSDWRITRMTTITTLDLTPQV